MHLLFSKLKVPFWHLKKIIDRYQNDVKIPSLLLSISGQSTSTRRPMQIYLDVGVWLIRFEFPVTLKKLY